MEPEKTVRNVTARSVAFDVPLDGYEIHLGRTTGPDCLRPSAIINGVEDGATSADGKVFGTYLHGLFGADAFRGKIPRKPRRQGRRHRLPRRGRARRWTRSPPHLETHLDCDAIFAAAR